MIGWELWVGLASGYVQHDGLIHYNLFIAMLVGFKALMELTSKISVLYPCRSELPVGKKGLFRNVW